MSSLDAFKAVSPKAKVDLKAIAYAFDKYADQYGVNTSARVQAFIAQAAHETADFNTLEEYATGAAYEGRADLGNTQPGDGVRFKGRGIFQTTGRTNYRAVSRHLFGDDRLLNYPDMLEDPELAVRSALFYWKERNLSPLADKGDFEGITRKINGGLNGWADRLSQLDQLKIYFQNNPYMPSREAAAAMIGGAVVLSLIGYFIYRLSKEK